LFAIDPTTGEITTAQILIGYSRPRPYLVNVTASAGDRIASTVVAIRIYNRSSESTKPFFIRPDSDGQQFAFDQVRQHTVSLDQELISYIATHLVVLVLVGVTSSNKMSCYRREDRAMSL